MGFIPLIPQQCPDNYVMVIRLTSYMYLHLRLMSAEQFRSN